MQYGKLFIFLIFLIYFIVLVITLILAIKRHNPIRSKVIQLLIIVTLFICLHLFEVSHATYYKYNDWWIKGRHISEVIARYGKPDKEFGYFILYYIYTDDGPHYYWIYYDENGIVYEVTDNLPPGG